MAEALRPQELGPRIGAPIPPFEASDQFGRQQTFETIRGASGALIVFIRSADW
ncbi:MAG: hypothetical protein QN152_11195 [Armatimonadota bacterium]|nr:hypothetical protein [Armatimonadota bacterium]MDR7427502.1 hypothetical protein [Armatimonadota bacterium]MDR7463630.1 hypothetical protein [Armatimonadota bacterium]MDR7469835.1 hypothetical protein [Armatimonadota bacterium]MDR7475204.1 hypothetical protein [Armatimonadota bacterium]